MRPAVLAALDAEAVIVTMRTSFQYTGEMSVNRRDIVGMDMVRPKSRFVQEVFRIVSPERPHPFRDKRAGKVAPGLADEHRDGAGVD
ncbi:MAG: hypothetical protein ABSG13_24370 [Bryobacteraceae bacterium]